MAEAVEGCVMLRIYHSTKKQVRCFGPYIGFTCYVRVLPGVDCQGELYSEGARIDTCCTRVAFVRCPWLGGEIGVVEFFASFSA